MASTEEIGADPSNPSHLDVANSADSVAILLALSSSSFLNVLEPLSSFPVMITGPNDEVVWVNRSFEQLTGWSRDEIAGKRPHQFLHGPETDQQTVALIGEHFNKRRPFESEIRNYRKDGTDYWVSIEANPVLDSCGKLLGYMSLQTDITKRRIAEAETQQDRRILNAINEVQMQFISNEDDAAAKEKLLAHLIDLSHSVYGFIGEVYTDEQDMLRIQEPVITNKRLEQTCLQPGVVQLRREIGSRECETLFKTVFASRRPLILNTRTQDTDIAHLLEGYPTIESMLLLPIQLEGHLTAVAAVANRENGYDEKLLSYLSPLLKTIGHLMDARIRQRDRVTDQTALRETESFLEETGLVAGVGGWQLDLSTYKLRWTEQTRRIHETDADHEPTVEEAIGYYAPEAQPTIRAAVEECRRIGTPWDLELPFVTAKGRSLWVRAKGQVEFRDGRAARLYGTFQDVTERVRAEHVAKAKNKILEMIAAKEPLKETLAAIALATQSRLVNKQVAIILADTQQQRMRLGAAPDYSAEYHQAVDGLPIGPLSGTCGVALSSQQEVVTRDTSTDPCWQNFRDFAARNKIAACWSTPIQHVDGSVLGCFTVASDISFEPSEQDRAAVDESIYLARIAISRSQQDESIRRHKALLQEASRRAGLGYWLLDINSGQIEWSEDMARMFGQRSNYVPTLEKFFTELIHPSDVAEAKAKLNLAISQPGIAHEMDVRTHPANGEIRWLAIEGGIENVEPGIPLAMRGTVLDITDRQRSSNERAALQAQLLQAQKMESIGRLAGGIAHDFNNMLAVILGHAEIALMDPTLTGTLREHLSAIQVAGERSADLTRQLLTFARRQNAAPRVLPLNQSISNILQILKRLLPPGIQLKWQPAKNLWPVHIDPVQIDQILANLLVNARDAIGSTGRIVISTQNIEPSINPSDSFNSKLPRGDWVVLSVADSGCGMDADVIAHIFEPFFTTKPLGEGTGLGLATVFGIVQQNGGHIHVESSPDSGTIIHVYLPRHAAESMEVSNPTKVIQDNSESIANHYEFDVADTVWPTHKSQPYGIPSSHRSSNPAQSRLREDGELILLVENEPAILQIGRVYLQQLGYSVMTASGPLEAIRTFEQHEDAIPLIIADMSMVEMTGQDLVAHLRRVKPELKCLYISGYIAEDSAEQSLAPDGSRIIGKPFEIQSLAAAIRAVFAE